MGRHPDLPAEFSSDLRSIFDNAVEGIYRVDSTGRVVMANQALARMLGYESPEAMLDGIVDVAQEVYVEPTERKRYRALLKEHGTVTGFETRWRRTDGSVIWVAMSGRMVEDPAGGGRFHLGSAIDITERKREQLQRLQAERAISESEARFRSLTELSSDFYWETDASHRVSRVTHGGRHRTIVGGSLIGQCRWEIDSTQPDAAGWAAHRAAMEAHQPFRDFEFGRLDADGLERHLSISGEPMLDEAGRFLGYRGIGKDITARKREERLLALEHAVARTLAEASDEAGALQAVLGAVCRSESWDCGRYFALEEAQATMRMRHAWSSGAPRIERFIEASRGIVVRCGEGMVGAAWASGEPLWIADISADARARHQAVAVEAGLRGAFVLPLATNGRAAGAVVFMSRRVREPDARLLQAMQVIGSNVGQFLQRKDAERRRARHLHYQETLAVFAASALGRRDADELVGDAVRTVRGAFEAPEVAARAAQTVIAIARGEKDAPGALSHFVEALEQEECKFLDAAASVLSAGLRRIESETRLAFLAQFDGLTGLPNRALLADRFAQMIVQARRRGSLLGVLFIDLDHFKLVNDSLGHAGGDALLQEVAVRLQGCVRPGDTVARISGDEFAVLLADLARAEDAALVAQKILDRLAEPVLVAGKETFVSASIGIASFPADGADAESLLRAADAAMYRAKQAGRNAYQFFTSEIDQRTRARAQLGSELRRALERNEFELAYQPKISLRSGEPCGAEALLRWRRPDGEVVPPAQFIPVLEETGLIVPVGEWVLTRACADLKAWQAAGLRVVPVAVNLSARQFRQGDLEARIRSIIEAAGVAPGLLELEITESQLMQDPEHAVRVLEALHAAGIGIAIDDFGTGYSSLSYLTRFPVSSLKIDRSFVADVLQDRADATIVRTVVDMAHSLGVAVVAEGVETEAQAAFLSALGCEQAQGFLFARPMPAAALAERIAARK